MPLRDCSHSESGSAPDAMEQRFDLVRLDYERTLGILDSLVRARATIRGIASTAYLTLLGFGVDKRSWAFCIAASLLALVSMLQDARSGWIYDQLVRRANAMERLFQHRLQALDLPYDPYPSRRLRMELEKYEFGVLTHIQRFHPRVLPDALSATRWALYAAPVLLGIAAAICI